MPPDAVSVCVPRGYGSVGNTLTEGSAENTCDAVSPFFPLTVKADVVIAVPYDKFCALAVTVSVGRSR